MNALTEEMQEWLTEVCIRTVKRDELNARDYAAGRCMRAATLVMRADRARMTLHLMTELYEPCDETVAERITRILVAQYDHSIGFKEEWYLDEDS